ncbi:arylsulfotransferase family protein [Okeania sp. SIO2B3]|uniref:arylsulfotransferase family protein n=1 Tax=Okeania sp. SIO2B3 TaxID=2607784 RepID=UPI0013BFA897|nr:arylsulfotransferase family protein [Okeania sp. SIO2B3]NET42141.1 hypothetical protein [Okeania sp. SIO2B3]
MVKINSDKLSFAGFMTACTIFVFFGGFLVRDFKLFPYNYYAKAMQGYKKLRNQISGKPPEQFNRLDKPFPEISNDNFQPYEGLNLVTKLGYKNNTRYIAAEIVDSQSNIIHEWDINWFEMWPKPDHVPKEILPKEEPGTQIHGAVVMENGDLVFNFEYFGLIRINLEGQVVWRLPYLTHHSLHLHDDGNLWVSGRIYHTENTPELPHLTPPFYEDTVLEVSPEGKILREWSVPKILRKNGYTGLLYSTYVRFLSLKVPQRNSRDILHLNDVEPFPLKMQEGIFEKGDVMLSVRHINTVFVFNTDTEKIKTLITGKFIHQHDPDFVDGNTISVFDNNVVNDLNQDNFASRIWLISLKDNTSKIFFEGSLDKPFYTQIMGKSQWLPNGNLLITESRSGRGFEINQQGDIVWQYINYVDQEKGIVANISEVTRLPIEYTKLFGREKESKKN